MSMKNKKLALGITGCTVVLAAAIVICSIFFGLHGEELLARGDEYAASGNIVRAAMDYEKYILEDKTNPVGYLRLLDLYKDDIHKNQKTNVYRRFVKNSGVDDEQIYVDAIIALANCRDYENAKLANDRGMERLGETENLHPIRFSLEKKKVYIGETISIDVEFPAGAPIPTEFKIAGMNSVLIQNPFFPSDSDLTIVDNAAYIKGESLGTVTLTGITAAGEKFSREVETGDYAEDLVEAINKIRVEEGKREFKSNKMLQKAADTRLAEWQEKPGYTRPDGRVWHTVFPESGLEYRDYNEIGYAGYPGLNSLPSPEYVAESQRENKDAYKTFFGNNYDTIAVSFGYRDDIPTFVILFYK